MPFAGSSCAPEPLVFGDRGWSSYPFFPSCWRADSARAPTSYLARSGLGPRTVDRPWAGEGTGGASLSWLSSGCSPSPSDSQLGEKPQHYLSITCDSHTPWPRTPPPLVTLTSSSEPCSDQITMMSIWGGSRGGVGGDGTNFFCILYCMFSSTCNQSVSCQYSQPIDRPHTCLLRLSLAEFVRPYISSLFFLKLI